MIKPTREELLDFSSLDDDMLLELIAAHQVKGLEAFYDRYAAYVFSVVKNLYGDLSKATAFTQDVFLKIWTVSQASLPAKDNIHAWLDSNILQCLQHYAVEESLSTTEKRESLPISVKEELLTKIRESI